MNSHELAEKTAGLASRLNNLAVYHTGKDSRDLLQEQARLADLASAAIIEDLNRACIAPNSYRTLYRAAFATPYVVITNVVMDGYITSYFTLERSKLN